jgi:hypothetical protein
MENHSCDTYVGRFPGADGATVGRTATALQPRRSPRSGLHGAQLRLCRRTAAGHTRHYLDLHRGRYATPHVHTVAASAAASAPARPAMRAGHSWAPMERRLGPAAQTARRTVRPGVGSARARHVVSVAPRWEARSHRARVVASAVVCAPLQRIVPTCIAAAERACPGPGSAAAPHLGRIRVGHVSISQVLRPTPLGIAARCAAKPQNGRGA